MHKRSNHPRQFACGEMQRTTTIMTKIVILLQIFCIFDIDKSNNIKNLGK